MQIYWIKAQAPLRVLALVKHLGIEAEFIQADGKAADLKSPQYTELNPNKKAPTMVDGDTVLWESAAIMAYLCIKVGSDMWPAQNPAEQVEVLRWLSWGECHWSPCVAPFYFEHVVKETFNIGEPDQALLAASVKEFLRYAKVLNGHLAERTYVACGRLTIADFQLGSMARYWQKSAMPMGDFPHITRWLDGLMQIPAWAQPWPETA